MSVFFYPRKDVTPSEVSKFLRHSSDELDSLNKRDQQLVNITSEKVGWLKELELIIYYVLIIFGLTAWCFNREILGILLQKIFKGYVEVGIDGGTSPLYGVKNLNS